MVPSLPRDDDDLDGRRRQLERARDRYEWSYTHPPTIAKARRVPVTDTYSPSFLSRVFRLDVEIKTNHAATRFAALLEGDEPPALAPDIDDDSLLERMSETPREGLARLFGSRRRLARACQRLDTLDDYYELYRTIELPAIARFWRERPQERDLAFAWQRLAGANPMVIRRVAALPDHFPVSDAHLAASLPGDRLAAAAAEGRLYLCDYATLDGMPPGRGPGGEPKFVWAPLAAFVWSGGQLHPIAIQCGQTPGPDTPIWTPRDGWRWEMAKTVVQVADGNHHQAVAHLGLTHLMVEPFVIATHRQLSERHPLNLLLMPHFEFTLAINDTAANNLIATDGEVEVVLAGPLEGSLAATAKHLRAFDVTTAVPEAELRSRGLDDAQLLPIMPYRDETLRVWAAIRDWVKDYLRIYYADDMRVRTDPELQAWARELASEAGGRLPGIGELDNFDQLVQLVAFVIWTASAQHAAVNFTQWDFLGFIPNVPGAAYASPPGPDTPDDETSWLAMLPPLGPALMQSDAVYQLARIRKNHLGQYRRSIFDDPAVAPRLEAFQAALADIEAGADAREQGRLMPYPYLRPSLITASIHI